MELQESGQMYLETILILSKIKSDVRSIDIVDYMGFSKPSVSRAVGKLRSEKYISVDNDGYISLTENGRGVAEKIYGRHTILTDFFVHIGVDRQVAEKDACRIEHVISDETVNALIQYNEQLKAADAAAQNTKF